MPKVQLQELYAHSLGVIGDAHLEFGPGFNVITGETGAGKTLLVGALGLCLGAESATSRYALSPDTRAVALFERGAEELLFQRDATESGRLRATFNGAPSSAEALRASAAELIVVHGQHDSLALRSKAEIVRLIDGAGGIDASELEKVRQELRAADALRGDFGGDATARERDEEYLLFQLSEIDAVQITSQSELNDALEELIRLSSLRDGQAALLEAVELFDGEDDGILSAFARALARLPDGTAYDDARSTLREVLERARESLHDLRSLSDPDAFDPEVLEGLNERVDVLQRLVRKYGGSLERVLSTREEIHEAIERLRAERARLSGLDEEIQELEAREAELSEEILRERKTAAAQLSLAVQAQLARVALAGATLRFVAGGTDGSDAQLLFAPNPGLPEGPLGALASGGELSRVLLAVSLESASDDVVAVFDEIDAGLGGQVAQQIGDCLYELARTRQVMAITHLASVAAKAEHHFVIEKVIEGTQTSTRVRALSEDERVREIARMLAGDTLTDESSALARQLLQKSV